mgnify:CR=1 FL=1
MRRNLTFLLALFFASVLCASRVFADVYRCSTDNGSVTLSNIEKGENCKKMVLPPPEKKRAIAPKADSAKVVAPDIKSVDKTKGAYDSASTERKRIIQEEIDLEKVRLGAAQARIKDLAALPNKTPDQVKELISLQQKENLHTSNLQLLQKELNR